MPWCLLATTHRASPPRVPMFRMKYARKFSDRSYDSVKAAIFVDAGAARAIVEDGASLLAVGVKNVEGEFEAEDVVDVVDEAGFVIARARALLGRIDAFGESRRRCSSR